MTPLELHTNKKPERLWEKWINIQDDGEKSHERKIFLAQENIRRKAEKRKQRADINLVHLQLKEGEEVLIKANNVSDSLNKIAKFFEIYEGPYQVTKKIGEATYLLHAANGKERGRFHVSLLKRYRRKINKINSSIEYNNGRGTCRKPNIDLQVRGSRPKTNGPGVGELQVAKIQSQRDRQRCVLNQCFPNSLLEST